jgi:hypothetical protein
MTTAPVSQTSRLLPRTGSGLYAASLQEPAIQNDRYFPSPDTEEEQAWSRTAGMANFRASALFLVLQKSCPAPFSAASGRKESP